MKTASPSGDFSAFSMYWCSNAAFGSSIATLFVTPFAYCCDNYLAFGSIRVRSPRAIIILTHRSSSGLPSAAPDAHKAVAWLPEYPHAFMTSSSSKRHAVKIGGRQKFNIKGLGCLWNLASSIAQDFDYFR